MLSASQLKLQLARRVAPYWAAPSRRAYPGFQDPVYRLVADDVLRELIESAPREPYRAHVFDCEDQAMAFRVHVARTQRERWPEWEEPLCVGLAMGTFRWAGAGRELHVANLVVEPGPRITWFDLRARSVFPFEDLGQDLRWILI